MSEHPDESKIQQAPTSERRAALNEAAPSLPPDPAAAFAPGFDPTCDGCQDAAPAACEFHGKVGPEPPEPPEPSEPLGDDDGEILPATEEVARLAARVAWLEEALASVVGELVARNIVPSDYRNTLQGDVDRRLGDAPN